jgi:hypothetical protein
LASSPVKIVVSVAQNVHNVRRSIASPVQYLIFYMKHMRRSWCAVDRQKDQIRRPAGSGTALLRWLKLAQTALL